MAANCQPLWGAHVAVNRTVPPQSPSAYFEKAAVPFLPEQQLPLAEALRAYTSGTAYVNHAEADTGSIEVGKCADVVVLDRDPFAGPQSEISSARVDLTFLDGTPVYERPRS